jgi:uncharacterized membrane protein
LQRSNNEVRHNHHPETTAGRRLAVALLMGLVAGGVIAAVGPLRYAPLVAWDTVAILYASAVLFTVLRFDAAETRSHALRENPGRATADVLLLVTSVASLAAVGVLIVLGHHDTGGAKTADIILGLLSVVASWAVVHTIFLLRYARLYYGDPEGGIDFNSASKPCYTDFAYIAFTVGMTFQVSDTQLQHKDIRATVLKQALLAYVFGTVIIATAINAAVSLSGS